MAYVGRVGLGISAGDIATYAGKAIDYAGSAREYGEITKHVLEDPALPRVKQLVAQMRAITVADAPSGAAVKGVGLSKGIVPLELFVAYRKRPWLLPLAAAAVLAVPFFLGKASKKR